MDFQFCWVLNGVGVGLWLWRVVAMGVIGERERESKMNKINK